MIFACESGNCLESNFTVPTGHLVLRGEQTKTIASPSASASTSVGAVTTPSATSTTPGFFPTPSGTCPTLGSAPTLTPNDCPPRLTQGPKVVAVGAGLGVSLGITILAVVALFLVEKRRNQRLLQKMRRMTSEDGNHAGQIWINRQGPMVEAPQDLARHEMPSSPLAHELSGRSPGDQVV
ncbi:hypothetical protein MMC22_001762 [Lobaria immixta]|nr:hypothetical protein [Lobaria immixta]